LLPGKASLNAGGHQAVDDEEEEVEDTDKSGLIMAVASILISIPALVGS